MRPSERMLLDLEKPPPDGTFLVLNVDTNTVGLGNSCFFQSFPPISVRTIPPLNTKPRTAHQAVASGYDEEAVENGATVTGGGGGDSADEAPAPRREPRRKRTETVEDEDPDWDADTNVGREGRESGGRDGTRNSSLLANGVKRPATPEGGNGDTTTSFEEEHLSEEIQLGEGELPQTPIEGEDVVAFSGMERSPVYPVNLLKCFGWDVTFGGEGHEVVYTSAQGVVHHSLPKAFENLLHDSFRRKEMENSSSQTLGVGDLGVPDLNQQASPSKEGLKTIRGRKKKVNTIVADAIPDLNQQTSLSKEGLKGRRGRKKKEETIVADAVLNQQTSPSKDCSKGRSGRKKKVESIVANAAPDLNQQTSLSKEGSKGRRGRKKKVESIVADTAPDLNQQTSLSKEGSKGRRGRKRKTESIVVDAVPDLNQQASPSKEGSKGRRGRKRKKELIVADAAPSIPQGSSEEKLSSMQERSENDSKLLLWSPEEAVYSLKKVKQVAITTCKTRQHSSESKNLHHQLPGLRRSARLNGKYTFYGIDYDSENDVDYGYPYPPEAAEERPASLVSDDGNTAMCDENSKAYVGVEILGSRQLDCNSKVLIERNQNCSSIMLQPNVLCEFRRHGCRKKEHVSDDSNTMCDEKSEVCMAVKILGSGKLDCSSEVLIQRNESCSRREFRRCPHRRMEHISVDVETNAKKVCGRIFVDLCDSDDDLAKNKERIMGLAPLTVSAPHEGPKSFSKVDRLVGDTEQFDNNNAILEANAQANITEIKRDMDLNRKDIDVDDGIGIDLGVGACFSTSSTLAVNSLRSTNNETPKASTLEGGNMGGGICVPDDVLTTDILAEKVDCDVSRVQVELGSNVLKKVERITKGDLEKRTQQEHNMKDPIPSRCFPSAGKRKSASGSNLNGRKKKRRGGCNLAVRENVKYDNQKVAFSQNKVNALSWLIDAGILSENEMLMHKVTNDRGDHLRGMVTRNGIQCVCCKKIMSLFKFESHAGSDIFQPWCNICLDSGKSLMQCQIEAWEKEKKQRKIGFEAVEVGGPDPSDDTCGVCADGGHLICCDSCPSTFHQDCVMLKDFPEGRWHCPYCICRYCSVSESGADGVDMSLSLFTCQQCYQKYHWECTQESGMHEKLAESLLFCSKDCTEVDSGLLQLLGVVNNVGEGYSWTLLKRLDEHEELNTDQKLLFMMECNRKLSMALSVLNECFMPLVDIRTGVDMISHAVYNGGSNFNRLNYAGFYTAILEKDEEIISVASLRFHGRELAEMPFIGTRPMHRRRGMCRRLLRAIEELLSSLHVEKLIIPATSQLLETWNTSFSFRSLDQPLKDEIKNLSLVAFPQTYLLQKFMRPKGKDYEENKLGVVVADAGIEAPGTGMQNSQGSVGNQTNSEICAAVSGGGDDLWRWNLESCRDKGKHIATQSHMEVDECFSSAGGLQMGNQRSSVSEASRPAQNAPTPDHRGDAPVRFGTTGSAFSSFGRIVNRSFDDRGAAGAVDGAYVGMGMVRNVYGDGTCCSSFTAGVAPAFRWTSS